MCDSEDVGSPFVLLTSSCPPVSSQVSELESSVSTLPRQCLLAGAFITYLSEGSEDMRKNTMAAWAKALGLTNFDLKK